MTAPLDEKGVELAAREIAANDWSVDSNMTKREWQDARWIYHRDDADTAIRAYLAASPSPSEMEVVAWMHPTAGWARTKYHSILPHCQKSGRGPVALVRQDQAQSALAARDAQVLRLTEENEALRKERDEAFAANERDRSIIADARSAFSAALERRSWLLHGGRGSYEWDDDRWKDEFGAAIDELRAPLDVLGKIGIDWSMCPMSPEEIAAARIDWKDRAEAAEARIKDLEEALRPFAAVADALPEDQFANSYTPAGKDVLPSMRSFRLARTTLQKEQADG